MELLKGFSKDALAITATILLAQLYAFWRTCASASQMQELFDIVSIRITPGVYSEAGTSLLPGVFRVQLAQQSKVGSPAAELVKVTQEAVNTAHSLQHQLIALRESATDLVDEYEDRVTALANVPVYLGLIGTFLGIMIGVLQIISMGLSESSIQRLLSGVLVAMFSSLVGLSLMIAASAAVLPRARATRDRRMSHYFVTVESQAMSAATSAGAFTDPADATAALVSGLRPILDAVAEFRSLMGPHRQLLETNAQLSMQASERLMRGVQVLTDGVEEYNRLLEPHRKMLESGARQSAEATERLLAEIRALAMVFDEFTANIEPQRRLLEAVQRLDVPRIGSINVQLLAEFPKLIMHIENFQASISRIINVDSVVKDVSTLPAILEVLRNLASTARIGGSHEHAHASEVPSTKRKARLAAFVVFGGATACFFVGLLSFSGTHFGAGLSFGGAILAYEALYVFFQCSDLDPND